MPSIRIAVVVCLAVVFAPFHLAADEPWDGVPFSADPQKVLDAAQRIPAKDDEGVVVLLDESRYVFDEAGRMQRHEYLVYRVADESAAEGWSSIEVPWSPWYSEQPVVDARVITKDGTVHRLDPKSFGAADAEDEPSMFTDTRILHGPLPAVAEGSVVEQTIVWKDKNPIEGAGVTKRHQFGRWVASRRSRMVIEHPSTLAVRVANRTRPVIEPVKTEANSRVMVVFETGPLPSIEGWESNVPPDVATRSVVAFSTGTSWADLARRYSDIVDERIGKDPLPKLPGLRSNATPREIAALILAKIERGIRYAGVEFGEGAIFPRTPRETLQHKYGDCKDKAIVLVAMLRQAGVPAHVALLVAGNGPDVDPELPGLGHFNHVIVVAGRDDDRFWVDPTDEFARAGELPVQDQQRLALIASPDTVALTNTPVDEAAINLISDTREFFLAEQGKARVFETSEYRGHWERAKRREFAASDAEGIRDGLTDYAKEQYAAKAIGKVSASDPNELATPFTIEIEALDAARGATASGEAVVGVFLSHLTGELPWDLRPYESEELEKKRKARVNDYVFATPYAREWRYRIHAPAGYTLRNAPMNETQTLGAITVTKDLATGDDGVVVATFRVTTGARVMTAAQYEETRKAIGTFEDQEPLLIAFDQIGQKHLEKGEIGKAIEEFRRWTAQHPKEASHHVDMARALLAAGLGNEARREARRAIEIEPKSPHAHAMLASTLIHDEIGRELMKGCDVPAAIASYRKARELDPTNVAIRAELAVVLEHNDRGKKHGKDARLAEAIAEWEALKTDEVEANDAYIDRQLMTLYVRTKQWAKLKELTEKTTETEQKDVHRLLAIAMIEGTQPALDAARSLDAAKRRAAVAQVGGMVAMQRQYPMAADLIESVAAGAPNAAALRQQISTLRKSRRVEEKDLDPNDPNTLLLRLFFAVRGELGFREAMRPHFLTEAFNVFDDGEDETSYDDVVDDGFSDFYGDVIASAVEIQRDGDEKIGFRLRGRGAGQPSEMVVFAVKENGAWKIGGAGFAPAMLALRALRLAQAGDSDGARQWLDWARDLVEGGSGDDPVQSNAFANLWTRGRDADAQKILTAAAALLPESKQSAELALPVLHAARANASDDVKWRIDQALAECYRLTKNWVANLAAADRLAARFPDSAAAFEMGMAALDELDRTTEMRDRATLRLQRIANDTAALRALARLATRAGQHDAAQKYREQVIASAAEPTANDYNEQAWSALFAGTSLDEAVEHARRAIAIEPGHYPSLNTLAVLFAEQNSSTEAREMLLRSLIASKNEPEDADWYVVGRIAENYGLREPAIEAYRKLTPPDDPEASCWQLAQKRLAELAPPKGPKKGRKSGK